MSRSRGPSLLRYREGDCPDFGRVRPVHLHELSAVESRLELRGGRALQAHRLWWTGSPLSVPSQGQYLSLHRRSGKWLALVDRVSMSCVCCPGAAVFIHVSEVDGVLPQGAVCGCAARLEWAESAAWGEQPGTGLCRKAGAGSLSRISDAIKRKAGQPS